MPDDSQNKGSTHPLAEYRGNQFCGTEITHNVVRPEIYSSADRDVGIVAQL